MSITYRWTGAGWVMGIPARDLMPLDLVEIEEREGITEADVAATGLYEAVEWVEVAPFCGVALGRGPARFGEDRCRERVAQWGEHCEEHT